MCALSATQTQMDDAELLHRAQQGDSMALECLIERHRPWVHANARRQLQRSDWADDVCQAVFVLLLAKLGRLDASRPFPLAAWLQRATALRCRELWRGEIRRRDREQRSRSEADTESPAEPGAGDSGDQELRDLLQRSLAALTALQRDAVSRRYLQGQSIDRIAAEQGCSNDAVSKRIAKGLRSLRRHLLPHRRDLSVVGVQALLVAMVSRATGNEHGVGLAGPSGSGVASASSASGLLWAAAASILCVIGIAQAPSPQPASTPGSSIGTDATCRMEALADTLLACELVTLPDGTLVYSGLELVGDPSRVQHLEPVCGGMEVDGRLRWQMRGADAWLGRDLAVTPAGDLLGCSGSCIRSVSSVGQPLACWDIKTMSASENPIAVDSVAASETGAVFCAGHRLATRNELLVGCLNGGELRWHRTIPCTMLPRLGRRIRVRADPEQGCIVLSAERGPDHRGLVLRRFHGDGTPDWVSRCPEEAHGLDLAVGSSGSIYALGRYGLSSWTGDGAACWSSRFDNRLGLGPMSAGNLSVGVDGRIHAVVSDMGAAAVHCLSWDQAGRIRHERRIAIDGPQPWMASMLPVGDITMVGDEMVALVGAPPMLCRSVLCDAGWAQPPVSLVATGAW